MDCLYLLHFDQPHQHARHYLGSSSELLARVRAHAQGRGARLTQVLYEGDEEWTLAAVYVPRHAQHAWDWDESIKRLERAAKRQKHATRYCPICCNDGHVAPAGTLEYPAPHLTSKDFK